MASELLTTEELASRIKYDARTIRDRLKDTLFWFAHGVGSLLAAGLVAAAFVAIPVG